MQSRLKNQEIDLQSLKDHEEKYRELKALKDEERRKKKEDLDELAKDKYTLPFQKSKFHTLIIKEGRRRKEEELEQRQQRLQMIEAAKDYAENVKK